MSPKLEKEIHDTINYCYDDVAQACEEMGRRMSADSLADVVCDKLYNESDEYQELDYVDRRNLVTSICKKYTGGK